MHLGKEMLFRKWGCLVGPENRIFRKLISVDRKKMALTTEIIHFKVFPERERERERARERKKTELQSSPMIAGEPRAPVRTDLASSSSTTAIRDRDRRFARSRRRLRSHEDRDLAFVRSRCQSRSTTRSSD